MPRGFESLGGCAVMGVPHFGTTAIAALDPAMGLRMAGRAQALLDALFAAGALEDVRTGGPRFPAQAASRKCRAMVGQAFLNAEGCGLNQGCQEGWGGRRGAVLLQGDDDPAGRPIHGHEQKAPGFTGEGGQVFDLAV